nr:hypothetical protein [uncultured Draconibacterium sp.]
MRKKRKQNSALKGQFKIHHAKRKDIKTPYGIAYGLNLVGLSARKSFKEKRHEVATQFSPMQRVGEKMKAKQRPERAT